MFNKLEAWIKRLIASEITNVDVSLQREKDALLSTFEKFAESIKTHEKAQQDALSKLAEITVDGEIQRLSKENAALRSTIREMETRIGAVVETTKKLFPTH